LRTGERKGKGTRKIREVRVRGGGGEEILATQQIRGGTQNKQEAGYERIRRGEGKAKGKEGRNGSTSKADLEDTSWGRPWGGSLEGEDESLVRGSPKIGELTLTVRGEGRELIRGKKKLQGYFKVLLRGPVCLARGE